MIKVHYFLIVVLALVLMLGLSPALQGEETKGRLKQVLTDQDEFVLTDQKGDDFQFQMGEDAKVFINDREAALSELRNRDDVRVIWRDLDGTRVASEIRCTRK